MVSVDPPAPKPIWIVSGQSGAQSSATKGAARAITAETPSAMIFDLKFI
jgi:hypothetical protein